MVSTVYIYIHVYIYIYIEVKYTMERVVLFEVEVTQNGINKT